jgi:hypothetical protein
MENKAMAAIQGLIDVEPVIAELKATGAAIRDLSEALTLGRLDDIPAGATNVTNAIEKAHSVLRKTANAHLVVDLSMMGLVDHKATKWLEGLGAKIPLTLSNGTVIETPALENGAPRQHFAKLGRELADEVDEFIASIRARTAKRAENLEAIIELAIEGFGHELIVPLLGAMIGVVRTDCIEEASRPTLLIRAMELFDRVVIYARGDIREKFTKLTRSGIPSSEFQPLLLEAQRRFAEQIQAEQQATTKKTTAARKSAA